MRVLRVFSPLLIALLSSILLPGVSSATCTAWAYNCEIHFYLLDEEMGVPESPYPTQGVCFVTHSGGVPDPSFRIEVIVRDITNQPIANADVVIFALSGGECAPCDDQLDGSTVTCYEFGGWSLTKNTDSNGRVVFTPIGGAVASSPAIDLSKPIGIYACGSNIGGSYTSAAFDLDHASGVGGADYSLWLSRYGDSPTVWQSCDYNFDNEVSGSDFSIWLAVWGNGGSYDAGCSNGSYCDP